MKVTINIPDRDWYEMAGRAEKNGMKVSDLIEHAVQSITNTDPRRLLTRDHVTRMVEEGVPDPVIAHRLHLTIAHVAQIRRAAGMKPVRFRRENWDHELITKADAA